MGTSGSDVTDRTVLVIGDVHGCAGELADALSVAGLDEIDLVVFAGDLIDKGPDTPRVVKMARRLAESMPVVLVEGNHEARFRKWRERMATGQEKRAMSMKESAFYLWLIQRLGDRDLAFLDSGLLYYPLDEHNVLVTHGGVPPSLEDLPPMQMRAVERMRKAQREQARRMQEIHASEWADGYDGRFGVVLFGHSPFHDAPTAVAFPYAVGLDLGCAAGNALGGAILRPGRPPEFIATDAAKAYVSNPPEAVVLPDFKTFDRWRGYRRVGSIWEPVSVSSSAEEALSEAEESDQLG